MRRISRKDNSMMDTAALTEEKMEMLLTGLGRYLNTYSMQRWRTN